MRNEEVFLRRYQQLNPQQRAAVDTVYGPVMVIAGPGTGKTEVLALRIANLLRSEAQVKPYEVLCLTFTDEATHAMRRRLLEIVGEEAQALHIYTFHAFCNQIIQRNPEYFGMRDLTPVTDLERMDILYAIIEELPEGHLLRRLKGDIYYDAKNLRTLFDLMKSEDWSAQLVSDAIDTYLADLPLREQYQYKRANASKGIKVGDRKKEDTRRETERMERTRAAAMLFPVYQQRMAQSGRYDFNDMILWVIRAFRESPDFLQFNQEKFQFILVDEFQDTSGAQNELLQLLTSYWEDPNLFIVGDDDQSIFEFQGARLKNIVDFYQKYKNTIQIIVLKENYRSSQEILDRAMAAISHNSQRLINQLDQELKLDKNIVSAHPRFANEQPVKPVVRVYFNQMHEEADIVAQIEALQRQGVSLNNVAVLYAQHKQASNIISLMDKKRIPYTVKRPVNVLDLPLTGQLLDILRYLSQEASRPFSGEDLLFRLMHTPFFGIRPLDVATLSIYLQQKDRKHVYWRYLLQDSLLLRTMNLETADQLNRLGQHIERWIHSRSSLTLPMLLERILYEGGIVASLLKGPDPIWDMQVLHTFFDFVQEECIKRPRMTIAEFLQMTEQMDREGIPLSIQKVVRQENGVRFYTAFAAKGHEFEHVFLVGVNRSFWEGKSGGSRGFSLPDTLTRVVENEEHSNAEEVARRVFYVALTRAKKYLYVSYPQRDNRDKELEPSRYIHEMALSEEEKRQTEVVSLEDAAIVEHLTASLQPGPPVLAEMAREELINQRLEGFVLSVSAMNKYLDCPISFYYEYILRVPGARSDALAFGIAVHYALEQLFRKMYQHPQKEFPDKEELFRFFQYALRREESAFTEQQFTRRRELGIQILGEYYDHYIRSFNRHIIAEYNIPYVAMDGVPLKGKLDKVTFNGADCTVIDYKTGSPDYAGRYQLSGPTESHPYGGDYWRQMVFYRILLENHTPARSWRMIAGFFDFIEKNRKGDFVQYTVPIDDESVRIVKEQIKMVYAKIMNREFDQGCGKEECPWCRFARQYQLERPPAGMAEEAALL